MRMKDNPHQDSIFQASIQVLRTQLLPMGTSSSYDQSDDIQSDSNSMSKWVVHILVLLRAFVARLLVRQSRGPPVRCISCQRNSTSFCCSPRHLRGFVALASSHPREYNEHRGSWVIGIGPRFGISLMQKWPVRGNGRSVEYWLNFAWLFWICEHAKKLNCAFVCAQYSILYLLMLWDRCVRSMDLHSCVGMYYCANCRSMLSAKWPISRESS